MDVLGSWDGLIVGGWRWDGWVRVCVEVVVWFGKTRMNSTLMDDVVVVSFGIGTGVGGNVLVSSLVDSLVVLAFLASFRRTPMLPSFCLS